MTLPVATARPVAGIDLGTSNSAIAWQGPGMPAPAVVPVTQWIAQGSKGERATLPSFFYVPHPSEAPEGDRDGFVGQWARDRGAEAPDRLVSSAKSWLGNRHVDPRAKILPWKSALENKVSPVEASRRYLERLKATLATVTSAETDVVLTVPASFDDVARTLTLEAAAAAGLPHVTLLEEPLAAFYAWIAAAGDEWRKQIAPGDLVLVCDVGGGTSDFSLISVEEDAGKLRLERVAVGEHLLLGGDNMDLALAHGLKARFASEGTNLDHWQFLSLVAQARRAKEILLAGEATEAPIAVASRGSSLFAKTITTRLTRAEVENTLVDGFFPRVDGDAAPVARRGLGIQELGLRYETDPAVTRHLAAFLRDARPTAILFNGGVFKADALRQRIVESLAHWSGGVAPRVLAGAEMDLAVALGATAYGRVVQQGEGVKIRAGLARSYYVGVESSLPAVPGYEPPVMGLCLVPQGAEEGATVALGDDSGFMLTVGEPAEFRFFSSVARADDQTGSVVEDAAHELSETARLSTTLEAGEGARGGELVPVKLAAEVTAVGTLKLFLQHTASPRRWNLELNVRPHENA